MGTETEQIKGANSEAWRRWLTALLVLTVLCIGGMYLLGGPERFLQRAQTATGLSDDPNKAPTDALRSPQVVCDEIVSIPAGGHQMRGFTLPSDRPVRVEVTGVRDTAKGFSVNMTDPDGWKSIQAGERFSALQPFRGVKVSKLDDTARLAPGQWRLVVSNTENIMNSMEVRIKITVDPN